MFKLALVVISSAVTLSHAGPAKKAANNTLALTPASLTGTGPVLVKKVKSANPGRVLFFDQDGEWTVHYAVALGQPLPAPELELKISDVSGPKQAIATRHKIVYSDAAVVRGSFKLTLEEVFSPNAKLLLEIESDGVPVASRTFFIQSKTAATGAKKIDFTAEEAAGGADTFDTAAIATKRR